MSSDPKVDELTSLVVKQLEPKTSTSKIVKKIVVILIIAALIYWAYTYKANTDNKKALDALVVKYTQKSYDAKVDTKGYSIVAVDDKTKTATNTSIGVVTTEISNEEYNKFCPIKDNPKAMIAPLTTEVDYNSVKETSEVGWPISFKNQFVGYYVNWFREGPSGEIPGDVTTNGLLNGPHTSGDYDDKTLPYMAVLTDPHPGPGTPKITGILTGGLICCNDNYKNELGQKTETAIDCHFKSCQTDRIGALGLRCLLKMYPSNLSNPPLIGIPDASLISPSLDMASLCSNHLLSLTDKTDSEWTKKGMIPQDNNIFPPGLTYNTKFPPTEASAGFYMVIPDWHADPSTIPVGGWGLKAPSQGLEQEQAKCTRGGAVAMVFVKKYKNDGFIAFAYGSDNKKYYLSPSRLILK